MTKARSRASRRINTWASKADLVNKHPKIAIALTVLIYAVPAFLFTYLVETGFSELLNQILPQALTDLINNNKALIIVLCCLIFLFERIWPIIDKTYIQPNITITDEGGLFLLESLNSIVRAKADRFGSEYERLRKEDRLDDKSEVFSTITKPDQQIFCIVASIWAFLEAITEEIEFEVRLVEVSNSKPIDWVAFAPADDPPAKKPDFLDVPTSALSNCIKKNKIIIVSDVAKEASKRTGQQYYMTHEGDQGAILCYPIYNKPSKSFPYVLCIKANKVNYFVEKRLDYYKWLLEHFSERISVEHNLRLLKEGA
ncbi:hypothetical protein [Pseudohongiella acticola]|jgi:hypothetical protein|uniref:hypothetical protein n=1 Tax=Pseudohongiella acticola TaxID=1524254 RepID=UPI0030ED7DA4